jgi:low affinity Fe/Cu permease
MVFLIQDMQNRHAKAAHLKLDEVIRALKGARNQLIDLEKLPTKISPALRNSSREFEKKRSGTETILAVCARVNRAKRAPKCKGI